MKKIIKFVAIIVLFTILFCTIAEAYDKSELEGYIEESSKLPKELDYAFKAGYQSYECKDNLGNFLGHFVTRFGVMRTVLSGIGMTERDIATYESTRDSYYAWGTPFSDGGDEGYFIGYELILAFGDGEGRSRISNLSSNAEAAAIIVRCLVPDPPKDLESLYELAKELNIVCPGDSFYDMPKYPVSMDDLIVMVGRMKQHDIIVPPITPMTASNHLRVAERGGFMSYYGYTKEQFAEVWDNKPIRRGTMYQDMIDNISFDGMSGDEVVELLGNSQMERTDEVISYDTFVYEEIKPRIEYVYTKAAVNFYLDSDGKVIGGPELVEMDGKFSQCYVDYEPRILYGREINTFDRTLETIGWPVK